MNNFVIFSDSSCDLPDNILSSLKIDLIPFFISFDGENYLKEGIDIKINEFYEKLEKEDVFPKTSLPSVNDYIAKFKKVLQEGLDILCICISSTLSGSYQSAFNAKEILKEEFPDRKILILDSRQATGGQGLLVMQAFKMQKDGLNIDEVYEKLKKLRSLTKIYFSPNTLEYLKKGGRIGTVSATIGNLLNIKPILYFEDGNLSVKSKVRGKNKVILEFIDILKQIPKEEINDYEIIVLNTHCQDEALDFLAKIEETLNIKISLPIFNVGISVGVHIGPKALGIAFTKKYETI